jgi:hypothetical protein
MGFREPGKRDLGARDRDRRRHDLVEVVIVECKRLSATMGHPVCGHHLGGGIVCTLDREHFGSHLGARVERRRTRGPAWAPGAGSSASDA